MAERRRLNDFRACQWCWWGAWLGRETSHNGYRSSYQIEIEAHSPSWNIFRPREFSEMAEPGFSRMIGYVFMETTEDHRWFSFFPLSLWACECTVQPAYIIGWYSHNSPYWCQLCPWISLSQWYWKLFSFHSRLGYMPKLLQPQIKLLKAHICWKGIRFVRSLLALASKGD